jgi:hypothetical protein
VNADNSHRCDRAMISRCCYLTLTMTLGHFSEQILQLFYDSTELWFVVCIGYINENT